MADTPLPAPAPIPADFGKFDQSLFERIQATLPEKNESDTPAQRDIRLLLMFTGELCLMAAQAQVWTKNAADGLGQLGLPPPEM